MFPGFRLAKVGCPPLFVKAWAGNWPVLVVFKQEKLETIVLWRGVAQGKETKDRDEDYTA
ncbi:MAG: hypothetical protein PHU78_09690 [Heliobacteriaceae bacterium]|nr:hypothetical protein [Heliobacteriaceae bacterium]